MATNSENRQINIYVNSGDAQKAYERLTTQNEKLTKSITTNQTQFDKMTKQLESFSGAKSSAEYKKLKDAVDAKRSSIEKATNTLSTNRTEMDRIQKKISGELSPSYNDLSKKVSNLTRELKAMSREDGGFKDKIEQLKKYRDEMSKMELTMKKTESAYGTAFGGVKSIALGTIAANAAMSFFTTFKQEISQGIEDAKVFQGVKEAFDKLNKPDLLDNMRHAVKGTVNDLEMMKLAVQANNFQIPLESLSTLFEFAKKRAQETGQSVDFLVNSIISGIGRRSPLILDNLGISAVRLKEAMGGVAIESKSVGDVAQGVAKIIQEETAKSGAVTDTYSVKLARNKAEWENTRREIATKLIPIMDVLATAMSKVSEFAKDMFGTTASENIRREQMELTTLVSAIRDSNTSNEVRKELLAELTRKYPDFVKMIDITKASESDLKIAMDKTNKEYERRYMIASLAETQEKYSKKIIQSIQDETQARKLLEEQKKGKLNPIELTSYILKGGTDFENEIKKQQSLRKQLENEQKSEIDILKKMADNMGVALSEIENKSKNVSNNTSNSSSSKPVGTSNSNEQKRKQEDFYKQLQDLRRDFEIAEASQDEKEIEAVRMKYAKMIKALDEAYPEMTEKAKAYRDEIYLMQIGALAAVMNEQDYKKALKANDEYFATLQDRYKQEYANGTITKQQYDDFITTSDIALKNQRVQIAKDFSGKNKQAEADRVKFAKDANEAIRNDKIKDNEELKAILRRQEDFDISQREDKAKRTKDLKDDYAVQRDKINKHYDRLRQDAQGNSALLIQIEKERMAELTKAEVDFEENKLKIKNQNLQNTLNKIADGISMASQLYQQFAALSAHDYQADLNQEQKANDAKKTNYKRMLDQKRITQAQYNRMVDKADADSAKKQAEIKIKQFEQEKEAKRMSVLGDTAAAIMRAAASASWPFNIPAIAFATGQGIMQLAAVESTKPPKYKEGGILEGPSHSDGGLPVYNPKTKQVVAELEGGETHMILSKKFTENNAPLIPTLLEASRTGASLYDKMTTSHVLPSLNMPRIMKGLQFAHGGVIATKPIDTASVSPLSIQNTSPIQDMYSHDLSNNILQVLQSIDSKIDTLNYEELGRKIAEYFKKYGVLK